MSLRLLLHFVLGPRDFVYDDRPASRTSHAGFLDRNPKVGNVGPQALNPDMTMQSTCRRFPTLWKNLCSATSLATAFKNSKFFAGVDVSEETPFGRLGWARKRSIGGLTIVW